MRKFLIQYRPLAVLAAVAVSAAFSACTGTVKGPGAPGVGRTSSESEKSGDMQTMMTEASSEISNDEPLALCGESEGRSAAEGQRCITSQGAILTRVLSPMRGWSVQPNGQAAASRIFFEPSREDLDYRAAEALCAERGLKIPTNEDLDLLFASFERRTHGGANYLSLSKKGDAEFQNVFGLIGGARLVWSSSKHPNDGQGYGFTRTGIRVETHLESALLRVDHDKVAMCMLDFSPHSETRRCGDLPSDLSTVEDGARCVTSQGVEFKRIVSPVAGFHMELPGAKSWFVMSKNSTDFANLADAQALCRKHGYRLPSKQDYEELKKAFGKPAGNLGHDSVFDAEAQRDIGHFFGVNGLYWTTDSIGWSSSTHAQFYSRDGRFFEKFETDYNGEDLGANASLALVQCVSE
jgi:hypothetical protein